GVVMRAGALDVRPVPFGGRIVQGEDQRRALATGRELSVEDPEQRGGDRRGLASHTAEQVVITLEVPPGGAGPQPTGDGAAAAGEEQPIAESDEPHLLAGIEHPGQGGDPDDQQRRQPWRLHRRLSFVWTCGLDNHSMRGEPSSWKGRVAPGTPYELLNFWESAVWGYEAENSLTCHDFRSNSTYKPAYTPRLSATIRDSAVRPPRPGDGL